MPPESDVQVEEIRILLERELKKRKGRKLNRDVMWLMKLKAQMTKDSKAQLSQTILMSLYTVTLFFSPFYINKH